MLHRRQFLLTAVAASVARTGRAAEARVRDTRTIAVIPQGASELQDQHTRAKPYSAELLPESEAFEVKGFAPYLTKLDEKESATRLPVTSSRRHVLSVGLEMLADDQKQLPMISRDQILGYLKKHFVSIQARIYRDPISRTLYLGPRCLAATQTYHGGGLTKEFSPPVSESVGNIRSLGLLVPGRQTATPSNLRTLVLLHKNELSQATKSGVAGKTNYEYLIIRGLDAGPDRLDLHAFATTDERTRFHWLKPATAPEMPSDCSVRGAVYFTEYTHQGLVPKSAVVRRSMVSAQKSYGMSHLERFAKEKFKLPLMESITSVIDAIIAGDVPDEAARGSRRT